MDRLPTENSAETMHTFTDDEYRKEIDSLVEAGRRKGWGQAIDAILQEAATLFIGGDEALARMIRELGKRFTERLRDESR